MADRIGPFDRVRLQTAGSVIAVVGAIYGLSVAFVDAGIAVWGSFVVLAVAILALAWAALASRSRGH